MGLLRLRVQGIGFRGHEKWGLGVQGLGFRVYQDPQAPFLIEPLLSLTV